MLRKQTNPLVKGPSIEISWHPFRTYSHFTLNLELMACRVHDWLFHRRSEAHRFHMVLSACEACRALTDVETPQLGFFSCYVNDPLQMRWDHGHIWLENHGSQSCDPSQRWGVPENDGSPKSSKMIDYISVLKQPWFWAWQLEVIHWTQELGTSGIVTPIQYPSFQPSSREVATRYGNNPHSIPMFPIFFLLPSGTQTLKGGHGKSPINRGFNGKIT